MNTRTIYRIILIPGAINQWHLYKDSVFQEYTLTMAQALRIVAYTILDHDALEIDA